LAGSHPRCQFHYLLGNHDYHGPFLQRLAEREGRLPNLCHHPFHLRLGDNVFLHGDAARRRMTPERLLKFRCRSAHLDAPGRFRRRAYDLVHRAGLHRAVPYLVSPKRRTARRIIRYLEHVGEGPHTGVSHVYFGHTHRRVSNYRYRGLTFHNGGAPIQGQTFRILEATM
jgi:UDP-2,3-diacylglucosamine hydrolase